MNKQMIFREEVEGLAASRTSRRIKERNKLSPHDGRELKHLRRCGHDNPVTQSQVYLRF